MKPKKDAVDSLFDFADKIVDGATAVLKDMPEPDSDDDDVPRYVPQTPRIIEMPPDGGPLLKSGSDGPKKMREVTLGIRNVNRRRGGGVTIIAETPTHEVVAVVLSEEDWKKLYDAADWLRMEG